MVAVFVCERDDRFSTIAALVLAVIVMGAALGVRMAGVVPG
jgi:acid phosphatase family membrane protein YuiD